MSKNKLILTISILLFAIVACRRIAENISPKAKDQDQLLDGPIEGLSTLENSRFLAGDAAFNGEIFFEGNGLGPYFVATSCGSCHAGDGKGLPFSTLTRFGQADTLGNAFMHMGGPQLQNRGIHGFQPELIPVGASSSQFTPPANTGLGFLEALSDAQILSHADPDDRDGDGISGRANYVKAPEYFVPQVWHIARNDKYIGRFGKKAAAINLMHQTVNAYNQDMGITSEFSPYEPAMNGQPYPYYDNAPDPEISNTTVHNVVFYLQTLKAPIQRKAEDAEVKAGKEIFTKIECGKCHTPEWTTPKTSLAALSEKTFKPYTDLLLHDMGPGLDDGYTEGIAKTAEWRTPALWGLGLSKNSQGGSFFLLHDGRAHSIAEAINLHGGEAEKAKIQYQNLPENDKKNLLKFLESL